MGRKLMDENRLSVVRPDLVKEWNFDKNGDLSPDDVSYGSHKKVWWICDKGHPSYEAQINNRSIGNNGCPYCVGKKVCFSNCLATLRPDLAAEWNYEKNGGLTPHDVTVSAGIEVWWKCGKGHGWKTTINKRNNGKGCPYCAGQKVCLDNCLATLRSDLAEEWHPVKNGNLSPYDVTCNSNKYVWWKCDISKYHDWLSKVSKRNNGRGCPYCVGQKVCLDNCLATLNPELAAEWHPIKNGDLSSYDVTQWSSKKVWWKNDDGNEWKMKISLRSTGQDFPDPSKNKAQFRLYNIILSLFGEDKVKYDYRDFCWLYRQHIDVFVVNLRLAIEYDGEYHFKPVCFGGISEEKAKKRLEAVRKNDILKTNRVKKHPNDVKYFVRFNCYEFDAYTNKDKVKEIVLDKFKKLNIPVG